MNKKKQYFFKPFLWQLFVLFCVTLFSFSIVLLVQINKTNRFKNGYFVVINSEVGYADKGFSEASILGVCLFLGINKQEDCNRSNPKFAKKLAYGYPNTTSNPKRIYDYILQENYKSGTKTFILTGSTYTEFLSNYIYELEKQGITIIAIDALFEPPRSEQLNQLYPTKSAAEIKVLENSQERAKKFYPQKSIVEQAVITTTLEKVTILLDQTTDKLKQKLQDQNLKTREKRGLKLLLDYLIDKQKRKHTVLPTNEFPQEATNDWINKTSLPIKVQSLMQKQLVKKIIYIKHWPQNLYQYSFKREYSGFNAGLYTGLTALVDPTRFKDGNTQQTGQQIHFAALGGLKTPPTTAYVLGFKHGIELVNEFKQEIYNRGRAAKIIKAEYKIDAVELKFVALDIIGGFDSQLKSAETKTLARDLFRDGVSVLFSIAVSLTEPMHTAAAEENFREGRKQNYVIGVDVDQGYSFYNETTWQPHSESLFLTSALVDSKELVNRILGRVADGQTDIEPVYVGGSKIEPEPEGVQQSKLVQIPLRYRTIKNPVWQLFQKTMVGTNALTKDNVPLVEMPDEPTIILLYLSSFLPFLSFQERRPKIYEFINSGRTVAQFKQEVDWF